MNRFVSLIVCGMIVCGICVSCGDNDNAVRPKPKKYLDLTEPECIIHNLLLSYNTKNVVRCTELLHDNFIWYMAPNVVEHGGPTFLTREEDIAVTKKIFEQSIKLELDLMNGTWSPVDTLSDQPCDDCWETVREYYILVQLSGSEMIYIAHGTISIVAVPVIENDKTTYKIRIAHDLGSGFRGIASRPQFSAVTWGQIKLMIYEPPGG